MRIETIECKSRSTAKRRCPWAARIVKVWEGYKCFESVEDARIFKGQK